MKHSILLILTFLVTACSNSPDKITGDSSSALKSAEYGKVQYFDSVTNNLMIESSVLLDIQSKALSNSSENDSIKAKIKSKIESDNAIISAAQKRLVENNRNLSLLEKLDNDRSNFISDLDKILEDNSSKQTLISKAKRQLSDENPLSGEDIVVDGVVLDPIPQITNLPNYEELIKSIDFEKINLDRLKSVYP